MPPAKRRRSRRDPALEAYRRIRKPMPPPERVIAEDRRERAARIAEREARLEAGEPVDPEG